MKSLNLRALEDELRDAYRASGLTRKEIADLTGVKVGTVKHFMEARRPIGRVDTLQRFIDARMLL